MNLYFTPNLYFIYFRYGILFFFSDIVSLLYRLLVRYFFASPGIFPSIFPCDLRFSFIRISVYTIPCFSHGLCFLYDLWISHYVIYSFFYHLLSFIWLTFFVITYGIFIARKFWKWRWFLRRKECLENLEFNFFPQSFEKRLERGDKWFSKKMEKILSFKCVCAL